MVLVKVLLQVEHIANRLTDMDWGWWPFLHLRPRPERPMTSAHVAKMSLHFGPILGLFLAALLPNPSGIGKVSWTALHLALACLYFFVFYRLTFAYCWNRRADRLTGSRP
ncbi:MAG: hypothetical protein HY791_01350 [Deltaproteobacteria bacterium]|nr:hypothetical protein [Deltaproteobacteria bacterium]